MKKIPYVDAVPKQAEVLDRMRGPVRRAAEALGGLVDPDASVGLLGIGASDYAGRVAVRELWRVGRRAVCIDAGQLWESPELRPADLLIAISASGESLETVLAVRGLREAGAPVTVAAVMAQDTERLGSLSDVRVPCADLEDSVPATISYLGTIQALALITAALGGQDLDAVEAEWAAVPAQITAMLAEHAELADTLAAPFAPLACVDFVGDRESAASAAQGALLFREAPRIASAAFDSRTYLHGPMEALQADRGLVLVGDGAEDGLRRIATQAGRLDGPRVSIGATADPGGAVPHFPVPSATGFVRVTLEIIALQMFTGALAQRLDLTSGRFRYPQDQVKLDRVPTPSHS